MKELYRPINSLPPLNKHKFSVGYLNWSISTIVGQNPDPVWCTMWFVFFEKHNIYPFCFTSENRPLLLQEMSRRSACSSLLRKFFTFFFFSYFSTQLITIMSPTKSSILVSGGKSFSVFWHTLLLFHSVYHHITIKQNILVSGGILYKQTA